MGDISKNFSKSEFACKCCGKADINGDLVNMLERLRTVMNASAIIITSGYRCPSHSVAVGGTATDAHTKGIAADIRVVKKSGQCYTAPTIAREAEKIGFFGIGIIDNLHCHVDVRNKNNYVNDHWFGDERTGDNYITTFATMGEPIEKDPETKHKLQTVVYLDGVKVFDKSELINL